LLQLTVNLIALIVLAVLILKIKFLLICIVRRTAGHRGTPFM